MSARDKAAEVLAPETLAEWREVAQRRAQRAASFGGNEAGDPKWGHDPNARILVLLDALEKAEQALAELNGAICWNTTCLNCASMLDASYREYVRVEQARADAWDEGYYAGEGADRDPFYWRGRPGGTNPYRAALRGD